MVYKILQISRDVRIAIDENKTSEQLIADEEAEANAEGEEEGVKKIAISDADAAKGYLAEHFSISRTKLKSLKAIKEAAAANGIEFEGL